MKQIAIISLCLMSFALFVHGTTASGAPLQVISTFPADNAVSVSAATTVLSMTFDVPVDTSTFRFNGKDTPDGGLFWNVDSIKGVSFSPDHQTVYLSVMLSAGKAYFVCLLNAKSSTGSPLAHPVGYHFTTAASFPPFSVSGNISAGSTGLSPAYALVVLSRTPVGNGQEDFVAGTLADAGGTYSIPYVEDGTYYSVAAMDVNGDGQINPSNGDAVGFGPNVIVSGGNVTGVNITLQTFASPTYAQALDSLNAHAASFPAGCVLRSVQAYEIDPTGRAGWEFYFTMGTWQLSFQFRVESMGTNAVPMDSNNYQWIAAWRPITLLPTVAAVDSFLARAERNGGGAYRPVPMTWNGFDVMFQIGDLARGSYWDMISDPAQNYLGVSYWYGIQNQNQWITISQHRFLGAYADGTILGVTGVGENNRGAIPASFALHQNYPNPFNPATVISYDIPVAGAVSLRVFDVLGREVETLVSDMKQPGAYTVTWNAARYASGIYFCRLEAGRYVSTQKMMLVK